MGYIIIYKMRKGFYILISLLLISNLGFSQVKTSQIKSVADVMYRIFNNTKATGIVSIASIVGSDTTFIESDGNNINLIAESVSINGALITDYVSDRHIISMELTNDQTVIDVGFPLSITSLVLFNGIAIKPNQWTGLGSSQITLLLNINQFDYLTIIN